MKFKNFLSPTLFACTLAIGLLPGATSWAQPVATPVDRDPAEIDSEAPPAMVEVIFESAGSRLTGVLYQADGVGPHPTLVFLHGYPGNEKNIDIAQAVRRAGWNSFVFYYRGAWGSEGEFGIQTSLDDVAAAVRYLRAPENADLRVDPERIALFGHSMGGFMALAGATHDATIHCVVAVAAANLGAEGKEFLNDPSSAEDFIEYSDNLVPLAGWSGAKAVAELTNNAERFDLTTMGNQLRGRRILLIAGQRDEAVSMATHESLIRAYSVVPRIELTNIVFDADHAFSWSRLRLAREVIQWLNANCLED